ncbi:unknown [Rickettsia conorii str. Malish 7]|uniref:Uncharacterized protein n=1 Tax=Rickettsia conorii (strain ATCC VR-613 / Malish 7) TaxID=272944 RepID=Q92IK5_RICCN|nr:unknown [Rickettsia conorii str. Malish 7]
MANIEDLIVTVQCLKKSITPLIKVTLLLSKVLSKVTSFVSALKKGIIYHKHGVTGVKLIKENAFKAKWDCDD